MTLHLYIMPLTLETRGVKLTTGLYPKYLSRSEPANCNFYTLQPYAFANLCIVGADIDEISHTLIINAKENDVWNIPEKLESSVDEADLLRFTAWVSQYKLPIDGLVVGMTYRELLRYISGIVIFSQESAHQRGLKLFEDGKKVNPKFADLKAEEKAQLDQLYTEKGYSKSKMNNATDLKEIIQVVGDTGKDIKVQIAGMDI